MALAFCSIRVGLVSMAFNSFLPSFLSLSYPFLVAHHFLATNSIQFPLIMHFSCIIFIILPIIFIFPSWIASCFSSSCYLSPQFAFRHRIILASSFGLPASSALHAVILHVFHEFRHVLWLLATHQKVRFLESSIFEDCVGGLFPEFATG